MVIVDRYVGCDSRNMLQELNVRVILNKVDLGKGILYINERTLGWVDPYQKGFTVDYGNISLHGTTKDPNIYSQECVFVLLDGDLHIPGVQRYDYRDNDDEEADTDSNTAEILFIPERTETIMEIYKVIAECQALNPDPQDVEQDEDDSDADEDYLYEDADEYMDEYEEFHETEEGDYQAGGDAVVDNLAHNLAENNINDGHNMLCHNGNGDIDDEEFEDAD